MKNEDHLLTYRFTGHSRLCKVLTIAIMLSLGEGMPSIVRGDAINGPLIGTITALQVDNPNDVWSSGLIVAGGQTVIIPRNMIIQLPANFLTIQQIFTQAPPDCLARGESGLSETDICRNGIGGGIASILANRTAAGDLIAVDVFIEKGQETVTGHVTHINTTDGYFRLNGTDADPTSGVMVRINDPESRHTIQQGLGCNGGPNCSPDPRFTNDPDNYTFTFSTGYPACVPSAMVGGNRTQGSDANGVGDLFCPETNRGVNPVPDSTKFAPIQVADMLTAEGNFEVINGVRFLSAHTVFVGDALTTANDPTQPDYVIFEEAEWDVPGYQNERVRLLLIGFTTLANSQLDVFSLHVDPLTNENNEVPLASTRGNPNTIQQGLPGQVGGIFRIRYDVDFIEGAPVRTGLSPCENLANAGFTGACSPQRTMAEEFSIVSPVTREIIAHTEHSATLNPGVVTLDINGNEATNGLYLTPVGLTHPEFVEINLDLIATPFIASGLPWTMDRRLSPVGCVDTDGDGVVDCEATAQRMDPFPNSGLDPRTQALVPATAADRIISYYANGQPAGALLNWPPPDPPAMRPEFEGNGLFANPNITGATFGDESDGPYVDIWASSAFASGMTATVTGEPSVPMLADGTGRFYAHIPLPPGSPPPASITVLDETNNRFSQRSVTDKVSITVATY
ncbi:MAG: hypothetical protein ACE5EC_08360, partial [Phycisphaerae bacterium]